MEFQPKCAVCPNDFSLERQAGQIVDTFREADPEDAKAAKKEAKASVSTMTAEGRRLECPLKQVLELRRETLHEIDVDLETADRRFRSPNASPTQDPAFIYARERRDEAFRGQSYDRWTRVRRRTNSNF